MCARFVLLLCLLASVQSCFGAVREIRDECGHSTGRSGGFFRRLLDTTFLKKFFTHWIPFKSSKPVKMQFFLYKRDFPECGREIIPYVDNTYEMSGFDAKHPTRIIIHGWMSQSKGSLNRAVKQAYLSLASRNAAEPPAESDDDDSPAANVTDFNVVVVDWSVISSNVNYYSVVELIDVLGFLLAEFVRYLHMRADLRYDDIYLIGHSLGAQIAGSAGRQVQPMRFNTIFALDPAGPKFRDSPPEERLDSTDALYVESIQTSDSLGFEEPVGHASFYPNFGRSQKKCYVYGCSHSRAHRYFAESITSEVGFWGVSAKREKNGTWTLSKSDEQFRMGGEPAVRKNGTFYVKTRSSSPYAMGRH